MLKLKYYLYQMVQHEFGNPFSSPFRMSKDKRYVCFNIATSTKEDNNVTPDDTNESLQTIDTR